MGLHTQRDLQNLAQANERGIISRSVAYIFQHLVPGSTVTCSFIQVYNERVYDLLAND